MKDLRGDLGKPLMRDGKTKFIRQALNGKIQKQLTVIEAPFVYYDKASKGKNPLTWTDAVRVMETYFLDSTDAMILNFALSMGFNGLVTCDGDFKGIDKLPDFHVYMPRKQVNG